MIRSSITSNKAKRHGVVLIVVLVLVMMLALAGFGFLAAMSTEYEAAKINGQLIQAQQTLASAEAMLIWVIGLPEDQRQSLGGLGNQPEIFQGRTVRAVSLGGETSAGDHIASRRSNSWQFSVLHPVRQGQQSNLIFGLQYESARLHLATLLRWEESEPGAGREALLQLPGMTEPIADAMLDWLDSDDEPREFGAESEYYQRLDKPYQPRNGIPRTLDELLFVKGITRELLHGSAIAEDDQLGFGAGQGVSDWTQLLTCSSAERNLNPEGESKIDLNASDLSQLEESLTEYFDEPLVRYILLSRQHGISFADTEEPQQSTTPIAGVQPSDVPFSANAPSPFTISSPASLIDSYVDVPSASGSSKSRVVSPLQSTSPEFLEIVELLFTQTTTILSEIITGRINIHQATEAVLNSLPEITAEIASQIIQERNSLNEVEKRSAAWLVSRQVVSVNLYRRWADDITTSGDVFTGEIVVFRKSGGPFLRRKVTIDVSKSPAAPVDWIDLTDQGLPVPLRLLFRSENEEL